MYFGQHCYFARNHDPQSSFCSFARNCPATESNLIQKKSLFYHVLNIFSTLVVSFFKEDSVFFSNRYNNLYSTLANEVISLQHSKKQVEIEISNQKYKGPF